MMKTDIAIIGAGPVGLFAIFQCGMLKLDVHVFDALNVVGGQCSTLYPQKPIYDIPAHPMILAQDLVSHLQEQAQPFSPTYHMGQKVTHIEPLAPNDEGYLWKIQSDQGIIVQTKAIIIAAGVGAFGPNRPPLDDIENYENTTIHYFIGDTMLYRHKHVMIAGGGDSALDWALALKDIAASVTLVHRRAKFRAAPDTVNKIFNAVESGQIILKAPYQLHSLSGRDGLLETVSLCHFDTNDIESIKVDYLLPFYGLSMNLGPITEWGLGLTNKHIQVDQATAQTNKTGIYAIGDVATYPNKLKLILTGFAEAAQAAHSIRHQIYPDQAFHFEYSTTMGLPNKGA